MKFARNFLSGVIFLGACNFDEPDKYKIGVLVREVKGRYQIIKERKIVPLLRAESFYGLTEKLDYSLRADFLSGGFGFSDFGIEHDIEGNMQAIGAGLRYKPFCENFGIDIGAELFGADVEARGLTRVHDEVYGLGANVGCSAEFGLSENVGIIFSTGYNFSDNFAGRINFDFDGWYGFVGLEIKVR